MDSRHGSFNKVAPHTLPAAAPDENSRACRLFSGSAFGTGFLLRSRAKSALGLTGLNGLFIFDFLFFDLGLLQHVVNNCIFQD